MALILEESLLQAYPAEYLWRNATTFEIFTIGSLAIGTKREILAHHSAICMTRTDRVFLNV
jgi:hypothetical protein